MKPLPGSVSGARSRHLATPGALSVPCR